MKRVIAITLLLITTTAQAGIVMSFTKQDSAMVTNLPNGSKISHFKEITYEKPVSRGYSIIKTPLNEITETLGFDIIKYIQDRGDKETVIIDWGCGEGAMLNEVAKQLRHAELTNVKLYGFSDLYFSIWSQNDSMINYIYDDMEHLIYHDIPRVDLIISHFGLFHVEDKIIKHFNDLRYILNDGGLIVYNTFGYEKDKLIDLTYYYSVENYFTQDDQVFKLRLKPNGSYFYASSCRVGKDNLCHSK